MAFNFNWSPLIADTSRARDMLTTALNKSPKPPIIVDDIIVTELNLGSTPPELEILEIGDLAEDRFRGIFKMSYTGDAYLTLKTRVQANPLNTYLSAKPSFASPQPLAAAAGLTIPLQITLSDIRLSGFVILVFSREKGITLVFRNDPLESLKVSSTFDSIPFVRDYLQKEIEGQLRVLFMEDLPAIIHRLSLRLLSPELSIQEEEEQYKASSTSKNDEQPIDPLASPPMNACDAFGRPLDDDELTSFSMDNGAETHATFSQKNLLRLAALTDSHRTLSLFTPPIRDAVFRAWAGAAERGDMSGSSTPALALSFGSRHHSAATSISSTVYSFSDGTSAASSASRPSTLSSLHSNYGGTFTNSAGKPRSHPARQRKNRVIDLRKPKVETAPVEPNVTSRPITPTPSITLSLDFVTPSSAEERDGEVDTPQRTPAKSKARVHIEDRPQIIHSPRPRSVSSTKKMTAVMQNEELHGLSDTQADASGPSSKSPQPSRPGGLKLRGPSLKLRLGEKHNSFGDSFSRNSPLTPHSSTACSGGILEQAWMMKMATEIARKVRYEKEAAAATGSEEPEFWGDRGEDNPPPAYAA